MALLTVGDDALGRAVTLISAACGNPLGPPARGTATSVNTGSGAAVGLAACATAIAAAASDALRGASAAEQAQVFGWGS